MLVYGQCSVNTSQDSMHLISAKSLSRKSNLLENSFELLLVLEQGQKEDQEWEVFEPPTCIFEVVYPSKKSQPP